MSRKSWSQRQILIVVLVFSITTGLLFGGGILVERLFRRNPLQKWVKAVPEVESFQLREKGSELSIHVKLNTKRVDNLKETLEPLIREVQAKKHKNVTEVLVDNQPSEELGEVYYKLSFALEEAKITGKYSALYSMLQSLQNEAGPGDFRVYLGNNFLYIQLKKQNHAYFKVVPRYSSNNGVVMEGGTG